MTQIQSAAPLKHTPLRQLHMELGARMVPFAGYEMPLQYEQGILKEHLHTRSAAGLFDVSHMGQLVLRPSSGRWEDAALALESLVPADVLALPAERQRYALFTNSTGGILDDLMIANRGDHFFLVVNAACKEADETHLRAHLSGSCTIEALQDRALLALQGPGAESVLARLSPGIESMRFMDCRTVRLLDAECYVSRSGYTGEDGFEISVPAARAETVARALFKDPAVAPIGLGARDSLRLEAGLCLYGSDLDLTTTPVEAALEWSIQKSRRAGGSRAGGFPGADIILKQLAGGAPRRRVGLQPDGRTPIRAGSKLFHDESSNTPAGCVSSGGFGPSLGAPIAMGYLAASAAKQGTQVFAEVRGKRISARVCALPFIPAKYKRS